MEDEIRPADNTITECLLSPNSYNQNTYESEEDQLKRALEESQDEFELQHVIILSKRMQEERETRTKQVASFKFRFTQFMQIDRPNKDFYSDMIRYIEKYESGDITTVSLGDEYYIRFRRTLDNMRILPNEKTKILEIFTQ
jgi:hypothetical protein